MQDSHTTASLRGISAVSSTVAWASGSQGAVLRTVNGGATWTTLTVPGAADLDFRGIHALDDRTAWIMSSGDGKKSQVFRTDDGGKTWSLLFSNPDPKGFLDAIALWDARRGMILGDPVDGHFAVFVTEDGGSSWQRRQTPPALEKEGAFAASNTALLLRGNSEAWFVTGGPGASRVFHSRDAGHTWNVTPTPIRAGGASEGIFSIGFSDSKHGVVVGGNYAKDKEPESNIAITRDGGRHWTRPRSPAPRGYRSAVIYVPDRKLWIVTGTSGSEFSREGENWKSFDNGSFNALSSAAGAVWAVGPKGRVAILN